MDYIFGEHTNRKDLPPVTWNPDSSKCVNPHLLICGSSGAGKTTILIDIVVYLEKAKKHIYIFDLKGDMIIKNENNEIIGNYIEFTAWDSDFGINPFEFDTGITEKELKEVIKEGKELTKEQSFKIRNSGPKVQINRIIEIIKKNFLPNMGAGQRDILMYLLSDTYSMQGFKYDDYNTWTNELPNLTDTLYLIERIKSYFAEGEIVVDLSSERFIMDVYKKLSEMNLKRKNLIDSCLVVNPELKEDDDEVKGKVKKLREDYDKEFSGLLQEYIDKELDHITPSKGLANREWFDEKGIDLGNYSTKDALRTVIKMESYIKALVDSGVFHSKRPPVQNGLNVINISGLDVDIQRFVVDIWLSKVFKSCKIRGTYKDLPKRPRGDKCDTYVVIDESKLVAGTSREKNDPYSYLNRIATEARSIGLGLVVASQSADHFPPEFLKNFYTQLILSTSVADFDTVRKSFGVDKTLLEHTQKGWGNALVKSGRVFERVKLTDKGL